MPVSTLIHSYLLVASGNTLSQLESMPMYRASELSLGPYILAHRKYVPVEGTVNMSDASLEGLLELEPLEGYIY